MGIIRVNIGGTVWMYEEARYKNLGGEDRTARYVLGTAGKNPLVFLCINPSTAEPGNPDPTVRKITAITSNRGYDSWIMLNIYPQRAAHAEDLDGSCIPQVHDKNIAVITDVIQNECPAHCSIVAAWGNSISTKDYLFCCLKDIVRAIRVISGKQIDWYCLGLTQKNNPRHPLFLNANTGLQPFAIDDYIQKYDKQFGGVR